MGLAYKLNETGLLDEFFDFSVVVLGFQGRRLDGESFLYYFRNRFFSCQTGRFLQRDSAGYVDGLSLYTAFSNSPHNATDPKGLDDFWTIANAVDEDVSSTQKSVAISSFNAAIRGVQAVDNIWYPLKPFSGPWDYLTPRNPIDLAKGQFYRNIGVLEGLSGKSTLQGLDPCEKECYEQGIQIGQDMRFAYMLSILFMAGMQGVQCARLRWQLRYFPGPLRGKYDIVTDPKYGKIISPDSRVRDIGLKIARDEGIRNPEIYNIIKTGSYSYSASDPQGMTSIKHTFLGISRSGGFPNSVTFARIRHELAHLENPTAIQFWGIHEVQADWKAIAYMINSPKRRYWRFF